MKTTFLALVSLSLSAVMALPANTLVRRDDCPIEYPEFSCSQHTYNGDAEYFCCLSVYGGDVSALCGDECHLLGSTHEFSCTDAADQGWHCHAH